MTSSHVRAGLGNTISRSRMYGAVELSPVMKCFRLAAHPMMGEIFGRWSQGTATSHPVLNTEMTSAPTGKIVSLGTQSPLLSLESRLILIRQAAFARLSIDRELFRRIITWY